jgi:hypothetical protein
VRNGVRDPPFNEVVRQYAKNVALRLFKTEQHPNRIAVSEVDTFVIGGIFFLDFSRPLQLRRWLGVGPAIGALVPVVHEGEKTGGYAVAIDQSNPYFGDIRELWKQRYPAEAQAPARAADGLKIIADFASQFPNQTSRQCDA